VSQREVTVAPAADLGIWHSETSRAVLRAALAFATLPGVRVTTFKLTRFQFLSIAWAYGWYVGPFASPDDFRLLGVPVRIVERQP
jgi:hypothetical protein